MKRKTDFAANAASYFKDAAIHSWNALAVRASVPRQTMYNYRDGTREPSVGVAIRIARALGTTVETLWG